MLDESTHQSSPLSYRAQAKAMNNSSQQRKVPPAPLEADAFTKLTLLLNLVLSLNRQGSPTIPRYPDPSELDQSSILEFGLLDVVSAILVQDDEVVATTYASMQVAVVIEDNMNNMIEEDLEPSFDNPLTPGQKDFDPPKIANLNLNASDPILKDLNDSALPHKVQVLGEGNNLWPRVRNFEWRYALMGPRPLLDHVATVCAYLNECRSSGLTGLSWKFDCYLVTTCWRKMYRRMTSWQALGFTYMLDRIPEVVIQDILKIVRWDEYPSIGPGDQSLFDFLGTSLDDFPESFPKLKSIIDRQELSPIYTAATAIEFHRLICFSLKKFIFVLRRLNTNFNRPGREGPVELAELPSNGTEEAMLLADIMVVRAYARLLLLIVSSTAFKTHLRILLQFIPFLAQPDYRLKRRYHEFGRNLFKKEGEEKPQETSSEQEDSEEQEEQEEALPEDFEDIDCLLKWIKTFVVHFLARRYLEKYCTRFPDRDIGINLLSVERSKRAIKTSSWGEMVDIIKTAMSLDFPHKSMEYSDEDSTTTKVIEILKTKLARDPGNGSSPEIIGIFRSLVRHADADFHPKSDIVVPCDPSSDLASHVVEDAKSACGDTSNPESHTLDPRESWINIPCGLHCEAVLASLRAYYITRDSGNDSERLPGLSFSKQTEQCISVSRLCCPVCWELLHVLMEDPDMCLIHARCHANVFPMELPHWLPKNVVEEMIKRFQKHLRKELVTMLAHGRRG